ncbi:MAG TPA: hypothetical protein VF405_16200 [Gammaproteobacteria bacterium]
MRANQPIAVSGGSRRGFEAHSYPLDPLAALLPAGNPRHLQDAARTCDLECIGALDRVLVLGAVRRAIEAVLALDALGHRAMIRLVSPRGLRLNSRERIAQATLDRLAALRAAGRLDICAGSVRDAADYGDTFVVDILPHGRTLHSSERYDWIVNCTERDQR